MHDEEDERNEDSNDDYNSNDINENKYEDLSSCEDKADKGNSNTRKNMYCIFGILITEL